MTTIVLKKTTLTILGEIDVILSIWVKSVKSFYNLHGFKTIYSKNQKKSIGK